MASSEQFLLFADVHRNGAGQIILTPGKPSAEVGTVKASKLLGYESRSGFFRVRDTALGQKYLRWRKLREGKSKIVVELESILAYREATKALDS